MLVRFTDYNTNNAITHILDYAKTGAHISGVSTDMLFADLLPLIIANSPNLASKLTNTAINSCGVHLAESSPISGNKLEAVFVELENRFGYLCLYEFNNKKLLYASYCGEITLVNAIKTIFRGEGHSSTQKNICIAAPIDCVITQEMPFKEHCGHGLPILHLSSYSYLNLNGHILVLKRIGKSGRDLQVADKVYITNPIQELRKCFEHNPEGLINCAALSTAIANATGIQLSLVDRLTGKTLPLARKVCTAPLTSIHSEADYIAALAETPEAESHCARLSTDWLSRAMKHKLNKFTPEVTTDGRYSVQRLTTEATIKYQGDTWKGASKKDSIYIVTSTKTNAIKTIIAINADELVQVLELISNKRRCIHSTEWARVYHFTFEFDRPGMLLSDIKSILRHYASTNREDTYIDWSNIAKPFLSYSDDTVIPWKELLISEFNNREKHGSILSTVVYGITMRSLQECSKKSTYIVHPKTTSADISLTENGNLIKQDEQKLTEITLSYTSELSEVASFNTSTLTIVIPNESGGSDTYTGYVKMGYSLVHNVNDKNDEFGVCVRNTTYGSLENLFIKGSGNNHILRATDYLFASAALHENELTFNRLHTSGAVVNKAIFGKKLMVFSHSTPEEIEQVLKMVSTGRMISPTIADKYSLGYIANTEEEYKTALKVEEAYEKIVTNNSIYLPKTIQIVEDDDDLLMDDILDDEEEFYEEEEQDDVEYTDEDLAELIDDDDTADGNDSTWTVSRLAWLNSHPDSVYIVEEDKQVYWFDVMHILMQADQPESAGNIAILQQVWQSIKSKMSDVSEKEIIKMMYDNINSETGEEEAGDTDTGADDASSLVDDDDDLFDDL